MTITVTRGIIHQSIAGSAAPKASKRQSPETVSVSSRALGSDAFRSFQRLQDSGPSIRDGKSARSLAKDLHYRISQNDNPSEAHSGLAEGRQKSVVA